MAAGSALVAIVGGAALTVALTNAHHPPAAFSLPSPSPAATSAPAAAALAGTWIVDSGSQAGYRVKERFVDQPADTEAVARTNGVTGQLVLVATGGNMLVQSASFSADLTQLKSQDALAFRGSFGRDGFVGRIYLETAVYPRATFVAKTLTTPAAALPANVTVPGTFTLHGAGHDATATLTVTETGNRLEVVGTVQVHFADYKIDVPQTPFTTSSPDGIVEVHLFLKRQG